MRVTVMILLVLSSFAFARQELSRRYADFRYSAENVPAPASTILHSYDVLNYKLYMDWYDILSHRDTIFNGKMEITFRPSLEFPLDSIRLDNDPTYLAVDSAFEDGVSLRMSSAAGKLAVVLSTPLYAGDSATVDLYYHVTDPGVAPNPDSLQRGLYLYYEGKPPSNPSSTSVPHTIAYTMSEPSDARYWMPCYDDPSDKAFCEISVRVPDGFVAASNGTLDSTIDNGDGSTTFYWSEDYPIATYLMCATAGPFSVIKKTADIDGKMIPVEYYVYPEDSSQAVSNGECDIDSVVSMIEFYTSIYGDYPFDKYGMTGIQPFRYGGMEHQTITTLNRGYEFSRRVVAHELAHQWWGDMVTLGTWKDIWLNESFATYSEAMQLQHTSETSFEDEMNFYASQFFIEDSTQKRYAIYAPPSGYIFGLAEYYKGAWVLHMLRNIVGDTTFFDIFRRYRADYEYGNAVTSDFVSIVDTVTNTDMRWFFNEWINYPGYPVYTKSYSQVGDSLSVTINQIQADGVPIFRMPMTIAIYSGGQRTLLNFTDSLEVQTFRTYFQGKVDSVVLDPFNKILARFPGQSLTDVGSIDKSPETYSLLQNYPNPFNGMTKVVYHLSSPGLVSLELYDVLGRKIETLVHGFQPSGLHEVSLNAGTLASGVYICRLTTPNSRMTTKIVLEK